MPNLALQALLRISQIDLMKTLNQILEEILTIIGEEIGAPSGLILLINEETDDFEMAATFGLPPDYIECVNSKGVQIAHRPSEVVLGNGDCYLVSNIFEEPRETPLMNLARELGFSAQIGMPLKRREEVIGLLHLYMSEPHEFTEDERAFVSIAASQAAAMIENARLYNQVLQKRRKLEEEIKERKQVEVARRDSEEKYLALVENADQAICVVQDGIFKFVNPKTVRVSGYSIDELTSVPFVNFIHPDDQAMVVNNYLRRLTGEKFPHVYPFRIIDKKGDIKWIEINAVLISWEGRPAILTFLTDITERKRTEEELRESKKLLSNIFAASPVGIGLVEIGPENIKERRLSWTNESMMKMFGFGRGEDYYLGQSAEIIYASKEEYERVSQIFYKDLKAGKIAEVDAKLKRKDGSIFDGCIRMSFLDPSNLLKGAVATISDISWRKQTERKLRDSEERLKILFEYAPDAYFLTDLKGNFIDGNKAAEELSGYKREECIGKNFFDFIKLASSREVSKFEELLAKGVQGEPAGPLALTGFRKDNKKVVAEVRTFPMKIKDETLLLCIARDITERVKVEEALLNKNRELEREINKRKQIEKALSASERRYKEIAEFLPDQLYGSILILS